MHKTMRAAIIDDDSRSISTLTEMLNSFEDISVAGSATNIIEGINLITSTMPDVIFLDIELKDGTGFDILKALENVNFRVIFTTSHEHYALEAIKMSAVDYLLKPFGMADLYAAVGKLKINQKNAKNPVQVLLGNSYQTELQKKKIGIHTTTDIQFVVIEEIILCEADGNYTEFHLVDGQVHIASSPLKKYGELLEECGFFRVNKSNLINLQHIKKYLKAYGGSVVMLNDAEVVISRRNKEAFLRQLHSREMYML